MKTFLQGITNDLGQKDMRPSTSQRILTHKFSSEEPVKSIDSRPHHSHSH